MNIKEEIEEYCKLNNIDNVDDVINKCLKQGFDILKYGYFPNIKNINKDELRREENSKQDEESTSNSNNEKEEKGQYLEKEKATVNNKTKVKRRIKIIKES